MKKIAADNNYRIFKEANKPGQRGQDNPVIFTGNQLESYVKRLLQDARKGDGESIKSGIGTIKQLLATIEKALSSESPFSWKR